MDYCLDAGDGTASIWTSAPDVDLDGDGEPDAVRMDLDGDGLFDDALADFDDDGAADHATYGPGAGTYTDDGTGTWAVAGGMPGGAERALRWFSLDGGEHTGPGDVDGDGNGERLLDVDRDGLADRAISPGGESALVDTDGDGRWDLVLSDSDGDGRADSAGKP